MFPTKFRFIWPSGFRGEDLFKSANQKEELPVAVSEEKIKCEKLTDDGRQVMAKAHFAFGKVS
jgi:hypothetical protein